MFCIYWSVLEKNALSLLQLHFYYHVEYLFYSLSIPFSTLHWEKSLVLSQAYINVSHMSRIPLLQNTCCAHSTLNLWVFISLSQAHLTNFCHSIAPENPGCTRQAAKVVDSLTKMVCFHFVFPTLQGRQYLWQACNKTSFLSIQSNICYNIS